MSDNIADKRAELKEHIQLLDSKISNPQSIRLNDGQPYANSPEYEADQKKLKHLVEEYQSLPNVSVDEGTLILDKHLSFSNGRYNLVYNPKNNSWNFYDGTVYLSSDITFTDEETAVATHTTVNSDNFGEPVDHKYTFKCKGKPRPDSREITNYPLR